MNKANSPNSSNSIISLRNYASQYIYNNISIRNPSMSINNKNIKIQSIFKEIINKIRILTTTNEVDPYNTPMSFLFQHIRPCIIQLVANCSPQIDKLFIEKALLYNLDWNIRFFNLLQTLVSRDIMVWFFLHIPYYNETQSQIDDQIDKKREIYIKMLEYISNNLNPELYFKENEFIFLSNQTCMPYASAYHNRNNKILLETYCKLLRKICPWLNYYSPNLAEKVLKEKYVHGLITIALI